MTTPRTPDRASFSGTVDGKATDLYVLKNGQETAVAITNYGARVVSLLVRGGKSWASDPSQDGRDTAFQNATVVNIDQAGHWVHHDRLAEFLQVVQAFLR